MKTRGRVFISYRRDGGAEMALMIRDRLRERGFDVFLDVEDLKSGQFNEALLREIETASDVVVVLSPRSMEGCFRVGDWMHWEVSHAIECEKNIVPVVMRGFTWPEQALPPGIQRLPYYQGIEPSATLFDASMDKLAGLLKAKPRGRIRGLVPAAIGAVLVLLAFAAWNLISRGNLWSRSSADVLDERADRNGWARLLDDKTFSQWIAPDPGNWFLRDGELSAHGPGMSHLFALFSQHTNMDFKTTVKLSRGANSGIHLRAKIASGVVDGYEFQLNNSSPDSRRTGSVFIKTTPLHIVTQQLVPDDTWWTQRVAIVGTRMLMLVNDKLIDIRDVENTFRSGYLALQYQNPKWGGGSVVFRDMMARRLPSDEVEALAMLRKDLPNLQVDSTEARLTRTPARAEKLFGGSTCCAKAWGAKQSCAHKCCATATSQSRVCSKCNPRTDGFRDGDLSSPVE